MPLNVFLRTNPFAVKHMYAVYLLTINNNEAEVLKCTLTIE